MHIFQLFVRQKQFQKKAIPIMQNYIQDHQFYGPSQTVGGRGRGTMQNDDTNVRGGRRGRGAPHVNARGGATQIRQPARRTQRIGGQEALDDMSASELEMQQPHRAQQKRSHQVETAGSYTARPIYQDGYQEAFYDMDCPQGHLPHGIDNNDHNQVFLNYNTRSGGGPHHQPQFQQMQPGHYQHQYTQFAPMSGVYANSYDEEVIQGGASGYPPTNFQNTQQYYIQGPFPNQFQATSQSQQGKQKRQIHNRSRGGGAPFRGRGGAQVSQNLYSHNNTAIMEHNNHVKMHDDRHMRMTDAQVPQNIHYRGQQIFHQQPYIHQQPYQGPVYLEEEASGAQPYSTPVPARGAANQGYYPKQQFVQQQSQHPQQHGRVQSKAGHVVHRRQFGTGNANGPGENPFDQEESEDDHHLGDQPEFFEEPLTNASRVQRRGRGGRPMTAEMYIEDRGAGNLRAMPPEMFGAEDSHIDNMDLSEDPQDRDQMYHQPGAQETPQRNIQRSRRVQRAGETGGIDSFGDSEVESSQTIRRQVQGREGAMSDSNLRSAPQGGARNYHRYQDQGYPQNQPYQHIDYYQCSEPGQITPQNRTGRGRNNMNPVKEQYTRKQSYRERDVAASRGGHSNYRQPSTKYDNPPDFILEDEGATVIDAPQYAPEYERYGDHNEDPYSRSQYSQQPKRAPYRIKYRQKTFDDEVESEASLEEPGSGDGANSNRQTRRGPKLIKFKEKKPLERLASSKLKSEQDEKSDVHAMYTATNTQPKTSQIEILKPYEGFEWPEFYQGPQWKYIRQSTNQNSKQKHYEKGDYDKVQYSFPGAELQDKEMDGDGEQKLFPPIDDFSDEDPGRAGNSSDHRAKVSVHETTASLSEPEKNAASPLPNKLLNILPNTFEQQKGAKSKKPAVSNKTYSFDQKKDKSQVGQESLLIQGLPQQQQQKDNSPLQKAGAVAPVSMEFAEKFFVQEQEMMIQERKDNKQFFEKYLDDQDQINEMLAGGQLWKGVVRMNPKFRHRAYVSISELNIDVLIESYRLINRALDGDTVLLQLLPVHSWIEMTDQSSLQAKVTTLCQQTGMVQHGMSHLKQTRGDNQAYTNESAIETRIVDKIQDPPQNEKAEFGESDQLSMSRSQSEDDTNNPNKGILQKLRPKKFVNMKDEDHEGYIASNSDNNIDNKFRDKKNRSGVSSTLRKQPVGIGQEKAEGTSRKASAREEHRLSQSSSDQEEDGATAKKIPLNREDDQDLWEDLETVGIKGAQAMFANEQTDLGGPENSRVEGEEQAVQQQMAAMTLSDFLGSESASTPTLGAKTSSYDRKELYGTREERVIQINKYGLTLRPLAKVVGLQASPNRDCGQMVTLVEIGPESSWNKKSTESIIFAAPVNDKLPWFILNEAPAQFKKDKMAERNPSHRYYVVKYQDWKITQRRPHCTLVECIGEAGNLKAESLRLLKMHDICTEDYEVEGQEDTVHECLKIFARDIDADTGEWKIPQEEIERRLDLRSKRIFTIDPITAKDLDDALSIEHIQDQIYEIGVHIADVSYFVQQGSDLDKEALKRGTSTYFVHRVYPMLPKLLCERLCSLNPRVDRLAYSIFFRMDLGKGEVDKTFEPLVLRSVIRSCAKWNYELAQKIIKGKVTSEDELEKEFRPAGHSFIDLARDILTLNTIAQGRRKQRLEAGSLVFNNSDFNFTLNPETHYPIKYSESPRMESKQLVEEFMLLANILVAECLFNFCKDKALLRAHADVKEHRKNELGTFFKAVGLETINLTDAQTLSASIAALEQQPGSRDKVTVVNRKFVTNMMQATYVCVENREPEDYAHYGLNFALYTHFTSPIRRYADLLVHRLLTICLKERAETRDKIDGLDYSDYAAEISERAFNARKASRECVTLFHCFLLKEHGPKVFEVLIFDVDTNYLHVYLEEMNIHLVVKLREDDRIDQTTLFDETVQVACNFKTPLLLCGGLREYIGDAELKKSRAQMTKEAEIRRMEKDNEDLRRRLNKHNATPAHVQEAEETIVTNEKGRSGKKLGPVLSSNCVFSVFDRIKIKVRATDTFPMAIAASLLITQEDMVVYDKIRKQQQERQNEMDQMATEVTASDGSLPEGIKKTVDA